MSENQLVEQTEDIQSAEDKFFGVKTTFEKKQKVEKEPSESKYDFEVVDDRPKEDRRPPRRDEPSELTDGELDEYDGNVKKRLKGLRYDFHEERRRKEEAQRTRDEAIKIAQQLSGRVQEQDSLISRGETALVEQIKQRANASLEKAKNDYRKAYEEGDTDGVVDTQSEMLKAQTELNDIHRYENNLAQAPKPQPQQYRQDVALQAAQNVAAQEPQIQLTAEAKNWGDENTWFMAPDKKVMTATAYGLHEEAVDLGINVNSIDYFNYIDQGMRKTHPDFDWPDKSDTDGGDATVTTSQPSTVVAPSARNNGAKPRKIRMTATQVALAKRLGLTNEQYARHADLLN
jgi:hypothetical protein